MEMRVAKSKEGEYETRFDAPNGKNHTESLFFNNKAKKAKEKKK